METTFSRQKHGASQPCKFCFKETNAAIVNIVLTQEPSLITVKGLLILDNDGQRIVCKVVAIMVIRSLL